MLPWLQIWVVKEMKLSNRKLAAHQAKLPRLEVQQGFISFHSADIALVMTDIETELKNLLVDGQKTKYVIRSNMFLRTNSIK